MFKIRTLHRLEDVDELPSVLDVEEVSLYLIQLIEIIKSSNISSLDGAKAINNLISYQGYNESGLSLDASYKILDYIKHTYNPSDKESISWNCANLANLTCLEAKEYIEKRLADSDNQFEQRELTQAHREIQIKT